MDLIPPSGAEVIVPFYQTMALIVAVPLGTYLLGFWMGFRRSPRQVTFLAEAAETTPITDERTGVIAGTENPQHTQGATLSPDPY